MINIAVCGAMGRMGQKISDLVQENTELKLVGLIEKEGHKDISMPVFDVEVSSDIKSVIKETDVVIDFSTIETSMKLIEECVVQNKKIVIGTTGFNQEELEKIESASSKTAVLLSPNMSVGVNLLFKLVKEITAKLPGYEKEVIEAHHNKKVDAPSGTAAKIVEIISSENDKIIYGRQGKSGPRPENEIGVHAIRAGNIVGEHNVMWVSPYERLELSHRAESRDVFASGAVRAAVWLNTQLPGRLYAMEDVLA